jgi:ATP-dependent RNA helicase SUPV3L1/SUV3
MGWVEAGPVLLRLDVAERLADQLERTGRGRPAPIPPLLASRLSVRADAVPAVLRGLGFRAVPAVALAAGEYGPPVPPMMTPIRRRRPEPEPMAAPMRDGPFAALAQLRR